MKSKKKLLKGLRLYIIIDKQVCGRRSIYDICSIAARSGAGVIQYRDKKSHKDAILKNAQMLGEILTSTKTLFLINDYLDIAKIVDCDGIHLGQCDTSIRIARMILGDDKIIGVSCHSLEQATKAEAEGADYVSIGPIFKTPTKPDARPVGVELISKVREKIKIPFFVIGGINKNNIKDVLASGAERVAVCSEICKAKDVYSATSLMSKILDVKR